jgi:hypothetical protein
MLGGLRTIKGASTGGLGGPPTNRMSRVKVDSTRLLPLPIANAASTLWPPQPGTRSSRTLRRFFPGSGLKCASDAAPRRAPLRMRIKAVCSFRSRSKPTKEMTAKALPIPDPRTV